MFKLFKYLKSSKKEIIAIPFLIILEVLGEIFIPFFMSKLIDTGIGNNAEVPFNLNNVILYASIMIGLAVVALIFGLISSRLSAVIANKLGKELRDAQFAKIQTYSFENIDNYSTSSLITRLTMDVNMVQMAVQMNIRIVFRAPAMIAFSIIMSALVGGTLSLVFVAVIPILLFGLFIIMKNAHKHFKRMFTRIDDLNLAMQEDINGIRTVKSYVREDYANEKFQRATANVSETAKKAEKWVILNNPLMQFAIGFCFVLIAYFGSRRIIVGSLTKGQFSNIITYVMQVLMSLMLLSQVFMMIVMSRASVERINQVLDEVPTLKEVDQPINEVVDGSFEFENVTFMYKQGEGKKVIDNVSFKIPSGSYVGIFGGTGTGKTTLIQLLSRLYDVTDGRVLVGGVNVKDYGLNTIRKEVITVLQKNVLFSGTVKSNILWGKPGATDEEVIEALEKAQALDFVKLMPNGIDSVIEQGGVNVSGGQRQRLTIARALIANPKILIMDDSTSAVDTKTDSLIREALKEKVVGMTKVVVSQRLSSIESADYIIVLNNNGIDGIGKHDDLYKHNKIYRDVYDVQSKGKEE